MKSTVRRVLSTRTAEPAISVDEIDISGDPALIDRYGLEIPVLLIDGKKAAKYECRRRNSRRMLDGDGGCTSESRKSSWGIRATQSHATYDPYATYFAVTM